MSSINVDSQNPWPGLASFTEESRAFFHGRDQEIAELARRVQRKLLTVLFGQSGLGKTSILRAGIVPRLRAEGYCPVYVRVDYGPEAPPPSEQIKQAVLRATADAGTWTKPEASVPGETLWEFLHHRDDVLRDATGRTLTPLIVFDQFEEIFTLGQSDEKGRDRANAFKEELADLVENRAPRAVEEKLEHDESIIERYDFARSDYRILISLREDYLPHLDTLKGRMPSITQNRMRLARMTGTQALEAVIKPGGALVTPEVARAIVEFVSGARGGSIERLAEIDVEPPLLSVICRELNDRRRSLGHAQITAEMVTGNRREILTDFYERSVADLPEPMRRFVEDKLLTKSGFRDNLALETALEEPGVTKPLIDTLVSRRLLRIEDRLGTQRVELTHDVLADVVRASRDARQQRLALEEAAARERRALAEAARRTHRMRFAIAGLVAVIIALSVGAVFGIRKQRLSAQQGSQSNVLLGTKLLDDGKIADGIAYLANAGLKDPINPIVAPRLLSTLTLHSYALPVGLPIMLPGRPAAVACSANGHRVYVLDEAGVIRTIDLATWRVEREFKFEQEIQHRLEVARDELGLFAVTFVDHTIAVYDPRTGQPVGPRIALPAEYQRRPRLSPDGRWIGVPDGNDTVGVWDVKTGKLVTIVNLRSGFDFAPDGQRITGYQDNGDGNSKTLSYALPEGRLVGPAIRHDAGAGSPYGRAYSHDGRRLFIRYSGGARAYNVETGEPIGELIRILPIQRAIGEASPDGRLAAVAGTTPQVSVIDVNTGKLAYPPLEHGGPVVSAAFSADGKVLFTNCVDGLFRLWDTETGRLLAVPIFQQEQQTAAVMLPRGREVVVVTNTGAAHLFRLTREPASALVLPRHPEKTVMAIVSRDADAQVFWVGPDRARLIDMPSGREVGTFPFPQRSPRISMSSYANGLLGAGDRMTPVTEAGDARGWTLAENRVQRDVPFLPDPKTPGVSVYNAKGRFHAVSTDRSRGISLFDFETGKRVQTLKVSTAVGPGSTAIAFSPDDTKIGYVDTAGKVHVCDIATGTELFVLRQDNGAALTTVRFSLDGRHVFTGDSWGAVQLWDVKSAKLVHSLRAHRFGVNRFDFSPDGSLYASLSTDGSLQVWDARTHARIGALLQQRATGGRGTFSPDNTRVTTPAASGNAQVHDVATGLALTDEYPHDGDTVGNVHFSMNGRFISTQSGGSALGMGVQRIWSTPPNSAGLRTPRWLLQLATICGGVRLSDEGKLVTAEDEFARLGGIRREIAALPETDAYGQWAKWFLSDDPNRPIAPGFTITPAEAKKLRAEFAAPPEPTSAKAGGSLQ
jgi:WD40 repeat protein